MPVIPRKVYIRHFGTVKETELVLPGPGLCLVIGHNATSSGVESIGAGKTLLGEAISRTLLGVRGRYEGAGLGAYSSDLCGNKNTLVKLECELQGKPLIIWSGYKCKELNPTGEGLRFQFAGGDMIERGDLRETRAELNRLLAITQPLAEYAIHLDGERLKFNRLSERQLVELFLSATSVPNWDAAQKKVSKEVSRVSEESAGLAAQKSLYEKAIKDGETDLAELQERETEVKEDLERKRDAQATKIAEAEELLKSQEKKLEKIQKRKSEIKSELKKIEEKKAADYAALELKLKRAKSEVSTISSEVEEATGKVKAAETKVSAAEDELTDLKEPDTCPTCGKPWDKKHSADLLSSKKKGLNEAKELLAQEEKSLALIRTRRQKARDAQDALQQEMRTLSLGEDTRTLSREYEKLEGEEQDLQDDLENDRKKLYALKQPINDSALVSIRAEIQTTARQLKAKQVDLEATTFKLTEVGAFLQILDYLYKAFGPAGLPNMVLQDCLTYLNRSAAHLSSTLTGNLIEISFSASKTLANATEKAELVINAKNRMGAKRFMGASKGEGGISNLIVAETLYSLGRIWQKVGYRWLDEAVNSQDKTVRGSVYNYFREQAKQFSQVNFVVDHSQDVESYADHVVLAEKSGAGFTTYRVV